MPTSVVPTSAKEPASDAAATDPRPGAPAVEPGRPVPVREPDEPDSPETDPAKAPVREPSEPQELASGLVSQSRWVDYDTHELLQMIGELEDERRWARLREGIWLAILFHVALLSAITWIPKYVFNVPAVIDPIDAIRQRKDLTYLDTPDALRQLQQEEQKAVVKPPLAKPPVIDRKTLEAMNRAAPPAPPPPTPTPEPKLASPAPAQPQPQPAAPEVETPRPAAVPARPNFNLGSQNPADQLNRAMRGASHGPGNGSVGNIPSGELARHPGAGGGVQILSDQQGVDFSNWLLRWHRETENTWDPLIPDEVNPPILKSGMVVIRFKVLPNGRLMEPDGVVLVGRSGDTALDRAAWGALTGSNYPPLPRDFHGPYLELQATFLYNMEPK
jgi:hypothetical protein